MYLLAAVVLPTIIRCNGDCPQPARCQMSPNLLPHCPHSIDKYYYSSVWFTCLHYSWCEGDDAAPFETLAECEKCYCK